MTAYSTLRFDSARCTGCGDCMTACAVAKTGSDDPGRSRLRVLPGHAPGTWEAAVCRQCGDPRCVSFCPAAALAKDPETGVVEWDGAKCVNCLLCTVGCAYAGIAFDAAEGHVVKCDHCGGAPACAAACGEGALAWLTTARIYNEVGQDEDLFVPGLAGCQGCNTEIVMRHALRRIGPDCVLATPPGCVPGMGSVGYNGLTGTKVPVFHPLLTNAASMLAGVRRAHKRQGRDVLAVALAGDGGASDVGFQSLSGAAERGEEILFIVIDNEGYMNTGMQRSSCTPFGAWTSTTPVGERGRGKTQDAKNLPLIMAMHDCAYVATASTAFMEDFYAKLDRAIAAARHGFAYLHVYSPCTTGWRFPAEKNIEVARRAVECNFVTLWEFTPAAGLRFTRDPDRPRPLADYLATLGKFRHLSADQVGHLENHLAENVKRLRGLAREPATA